MILNVRVWTDCVAIYLESDRIISQQTPVIQICQNVSFNAMRGTSQAAFGSWRASSISIMTICLVVASIGTSVGKDSMHLSPADLNNKLLSSSPPQWKTRPKPVKLHDRRPRTSALVAKVLPFSKLAQHGAGRQQRQLISARAIIANVLATICPQGMLPIGKWYFNETEFIVGHLTHE